MAQLNREILDIYPIAVAIGYCKLVLIDRRPNLPMLRISELVQYLHYMTTLAPLRCLPSARAAIGCSIYLVVGGRHQNGIGGYVFYGAGLGGRHCAEDIDTPDGSACTLAFFYDYEYNVNTRLTKKQ